MIADPLIRPPWSQIVVHHTASTDHASLDTDNIEEWHRTQGWRDIGYHCVVELVEDKYVAIHGRPLTMEGAHEPKANRTGLGIAFAGNFEEDKVPHEQLVVGADVIAGWCACFGIQPHRIRTHRDFKPTKCPGNHFPIGELRALVVHHLVEEGWFIAT